MRNVMLGLVLALPTLSLAADLEALRRGQMPDDHRLGELQTLNGYFPFRSVASAEDWPARQQQIRRRILVSQGLWPLPTKTPLNAVIHGRVDRDQYTVQRVYFESIPGHYVTGSLYRPKGRSGARPAILSPHGHWSNGRFYDAGENHVRDDLKIGAEQFAVGGRYPIQARAVQLARMGCIVFVYDMTGNADSIQIAHRPDRWSHLDRQEDWGFMSVQAEARLQNMMGLQTWNSIRVIDFLSELPDVDSSRIGVTGASGGGTQSMIIGAIDDRIAAAMPCVMVSTAMQGGCTCENASLLRIGQGNVDIAAAIAPRPLGLTAADDWTVELETKGYPDLLNLYDTLGCRDHLTAVFHTQFKHNYNQVNRAAMYGFFDRHFDLGSGGKIAERDFRPLTREEASVWTEAHPAPSGDQIGDPHEIRILNLTTRDSDRKMQRLVPTRPDDLARFERVVGSAWQTILGRRLQEVGEVTLHETGRVSIEGIDVVVGLVSHAHSLAEGASEESDGPKQADAGKAKTRVEQFPVVRFLAQGERRGAVIWVCEEGKSDLAPDGKLLAPVRELTRSGFDVVAADLFGQGEFRAGQGPMESQRMWTQRDGKQGWHRFAGYTFGYNHPVFVKRTHDVLSMIRLMTAESGTIHLVGIGRVAGPLAAAARSQAGEAVDHALIDCQGFRFESLRRHDDPMFVPGAVKYLDIDGLLASGDQSELSLVGLADDSVVAKVFLAAGRSDRLHLLPDRQSLMDALRTTAVTQTDRKSGQR